MLSASCKIAIKSVLYIASKSLCACQNIKYKEIAENISENEHTVGKILQKLAKYDVIKSVKGPTGGFYITDKQKEQRIIRIVLAVDGEDVFEKCGLGLKKCKDTKPCPFHNEYKPLREMLKKTCKEKKISDLCLDVNNGIFHLSSSKKGVF